MTQKIKIISCTKHRKKHYDYSELIGKEFNVKSGGSKYYNLEGVKGVILKSDCEEVSAPESQAHLLTERSEPCGNCKETIKECACMRNICFKCNKPVGNITFSVCDECWNILHPPKNNSAKELLASQPPVMEGKEEKITYQTTLTDKELINLCDEWVSKMCKTGGKAFTMSVPVRLNYDTDVVLSALINRFSLANKTIQSLQSEVEQLKGLLKEAQPFCGTMLRGKIEHYTSK
jgi:hypothetical protein